jgi:hypothetical protein
VKCAQLYPSPGKYQSEDYFWHGEGKGEGEAKKQLAMKKVQCAIYKGKVKDINKFSS